LQRRSQYLTLVTTPRLLNKSIDFTNTGIASRLGDSGPSTSSTTPRKHLTDTSAGTWSRRTRESQTNTRRRRERESLPLLSFPTNSTPESDWRETEKNRKNLIKRRKSKTEKINRDKTYKIKLQNRIALRIKKLTIRRKRRG
jgi:hypothetical protein